MRHLFYILLFFPLFTYSQNVNHKEIIKDFLFDIQLIESSEEVMNKYFEKEIHTDSVKLALESMRIDLADFTKTGLLQNIVELNRPFPSFYCGFSKPNSNETSAFLRVEFENWESKKIIRWAFANSALTNKLKQEEEESQAPPPPPPPPPFPPPIGD